LAEFQLLSDNMPSFDQVANSKKRKARARASNAKQNKKQSKAKQSKANKQKMQQEAERT
jgi:hypothetical protein